MSHSKRHARPQTNITRDGHFRNRQVGTNPRACNFLAQTFFPTMEVFVVWICCIHISSRDSSCRDISSLTRFSWSSAHAAILRLCSIVKQPFVSKTKTSAILGRLTHMMSRDSVGRVASNRLLPDSTDRAECTSN